MSFPGSVVIEVTTLLCSLILFFVAILSDFSFRLIPNVIPYAFIGLFCFLGLVDGGVFFYRVFFDAHVHNVGSLESLSLENLGRSLGRGFGNPVEAVPSFLTFMSPVLFSALGAFLIFCLFFGLWFIGFIGGGDVKLIASSALLLTPLQQKDYIINITLVGGILALIYLLLRFRERRFKKRENKKKEKRGCNDKKSVIYTLQENKEAFKTRFIDSQSFYDSVRKGWWIEVQRIWRVERWRLQKRAPLPYGVAIAVGFFITFFYG
ncbi:MAG: hypothetical protein IJ934_04100 [Acetobacter sp.]|nr:hypothetical protein [Acetobacter sp.]